MHVDEHPEIQYKRVFVKCSMSVQDSGSETSPSLLKSQWNFAQHFKKLLGRPDFFFSVQPILKLLD